MFRQAQMGDESLNKSYPILQSKRTAMLPFALRGIGEFHSDKNYFTKRSGMNQCLIIYTLSGEGIMEYRGKTSTLEPGKLIVIDCREFQYYATKVERWHFLWIHFDGKCAFEYVNQLNADGGVPIYVGNRISFQSYHEKIVSHILHSTLQSELEISVILHRLLTDIIHLKQIDAFSIKYSGYQKELDQSISFLRQYLQEDISVEDLAERCHLSKYYYIKMFKAYIGQSPYDYLINIRLQHAQKLLLGTEQTVEEIAIASGFSESKNFIACFKKKVGITPLQFRKQNRLA